MEANALGDILVPFELVIVSIRLAFPVTCTATGCVLLLLFAAAAVVVAAVVGDVIFLVSESIKDTLAGLVVEVIADLAGEFGMATSVILLSRDVPARDDDATVDEEDEVATADASGGDDDDENDEDDESPADNDTVVNCTPCLPSWSSIFIRFVLHSSISILSIYLSLYTIIFLLIYK